MGTGAKMLKMEKLGLAEALNTQPPMDGFLSGAKEQEIGPGDRRSATLQRRSNKVALVFGQSTVIGIELIWSECQNPQG
jgi:hypothetical protein